MKINILEIITISKLIKFLKFSTVLIIIIIFKIFKYINNKSSKVLNKIFYERTLIGFLHNKIIYVYEKFITKFPSLFFYYITSNLGLLSLYNIIIPERLQRISGHTYCTGIKSFIVFFLLIALKAFADVYIK